MKKLLFLSLFIGIITSVTAQNTVTNNGVEYTIKEDRIYIAENDVTETLTIENKEAILATYREQEKLREEKELVLKQAEMEVKKANAAQEKEREQAEKEQRRLEKEQKRLEKERKKAEKERKKAEKALKKQEQAKKQYDKAKEKYQDANQKYNKLKNKGDLSPNDELKWLKKIDKLSDKLNKAERKL